MQKILFFLFLFSGRALLLLTQVELLLAPSGVAINNSDGAVCT